MHPAASETMFIDSLLTHSGRFAGRIERTPEGPGTFSAMYLTVPVDFTGKQVTVRGWLRLDGVTEWAGLWQRQDGPSKWVQFDNMQDRQIRGTIDWQQYEVTLPLDSRAKSISFGALVSGPGKLWVDDVELLVDGRSYHETPVVMPTPTAMATDHEFDAGSKIEARTLSRQQIDNLTLLGKVWGFLKYHHPRVTAAQVHWDYELFRITPKILAARDRGAAEKAVSTWLATIGDPPACKPCASDTAAVHLSPRLEWISDHKRLGKRLSQQLRSIHVNRDADDEQYWVSLAPGIGNPVFKVESSAPENTLPDAGYRLLAVFRFWNIVEYWFPYRDLIEESWDGVLAEFIPRAFGAGTMDEYALTMMALIARVHDTHANLWSSLDLRPPTGDCELPVRLRFIEGRALVTGYTSTDSVPLPELEIGDAITAIDGTPVDSLVAQRRFIYAASNEPTRLRDMARQLTRGPCADVRVTRERNGTAAEIVLARQKRPTDPPRRWNDVPGETFQRVSPDLAYLKLSAVESKKCSEYVEQAAGARCWVIDIRNYPSEFVVFELGQHLVAEPTEFVRFTYGDLTNPGAFRWTQPIPIQPKAPRFEGRIVILIDESTQSSAEYTTMAFRSAPGALVVGSTTAGADGNVSPIPLPGGLRTLVSGIGVFYPDRRPTQRIGIVPDKVVVPTRAGIRAGRDEVLEEAVKLVLGREMTNDERAALTPSWSNGRTAQASQTR